MEDHRRPDGSPPPWENADGWVVARAEDGQQGYPPQQPVPQQPAPPEPPPPEPPPPEPWYADTYGEDPYGGGGAPPAYEPAPPQPAPQPYWPGTPAPPDAGFRWYREVAPGQWVPSDPPASAYPANGATYPPPPPPPHPYPPPAPEPYAAPQQYAPQQYAPQQYAPQQYAPQQYAPQQPYRAPQPYAAGQPYAPPAPFEAVPPVSAPVPHEPPVDREPGPWQPPPRRTRRERPLLPELEEDDQSGPPEQGVEASSLAVLSWTLSCFLVPLLAYLGWALTRSDVADPNCVDETGAPCASPRGEAIEALANVGPALTAALFLAAVAAIVMRRLTASWRASMVGFAAAVVGAATATLVSGILR